MPEPRALFEYRPIPVGEVLRRRLKEKGWTHEEFALITKRSRRALANLLSGKSSLTRGMAVAIAAAFNEDPNEWLRLDMAYRQHLAEDDTTEIKRLAELFTLAPVKDMERRGWIRPTHTAEDLRAELSAFFETDPIEKGVHLPVATRRTMALPELGAAEIAWCFRARQLAKSMLANPFSPDKLSHAKTGLRKLAAHPKEARRIPQLLAGYGIRFVVIEPLPGVRIDGATLWDEVGPIVAVSIRHDRIDGFWFTLMHEIEHVKNQDPISVDSGLVDGTRGITVSLMNDVAEDLANQGAATSLISASEMESFIRRVGPLYAKDRVIQFANRVKIHPGIIVGQLQYRGELGYMALRDFLVKIRDSVISTALTDGWGHSISPSNA